MSPRAGVHHLRSLRIIPERVNQLSEVALREPLISQPHRLGPLVTGQVVGAEEPVDQREVDREVLVVERGIIAVVPVVILRRDQQVFEKPKRDAGVGMDADRLQGNDRHIGVEHRHGEAQYVERNV